MKHIYIYCIYIYIHVCIYDYICSVKWMSIFIEFIDLICHFIVCWTHGTRRIIVYEQVFGSGIFLNFWDPNGIPYLATHFSSVFLRPHTADTAVWWGLSKEDQADVGLTGASPQCGWLKAPKGAKVRLRWELHWWLLQVIYSFQGSVFLWSKIPIQPHFLEMSCIVLIHIYKHI